jgi:hypothetical protein
VRAVLPAHGKVAHRCNGPDPIPVLIHLPVPAASRKFVVTDDLGGTFVRSVHATVSTAGSSATTVEVENLTNADPILSTATTIDSGDTTSYDAATPHVVDGTGTPPINYVLRGDVLEVTATKGSGATDLVVLLEFGPHVVKVTPP